MCANWKYFIVEGVKCPFGNWTDPPVEQPSSTVNKPPTEHLGFCWLIGETQKAMTVLSSKRVLEDNHTRDPSAITALTLTHKALTDVSRLNQIPGLIGLISRLRIWFIWLLVGLVLERVQELGEARPQRQQSNFTRGKSVLCLFVLRGWSISFVGLIWFWFVLMGNVGFEVMCQFEMVISCTEQASELERNWRPYQAHCE